MPLNNTSFKAKYLSVGILLSLLISACAPAVSPQISPSQPSPAEPSTATPSLGEKDENTSVTTEIIPAYAPQGTPTPIPPAPDRQKPEDWRDWPIIPIPSARARQIYQQGIAAGTDPTRLSKVGDCQAIQEVLLGRYDKPSGFVLSENTDALTQTIQQFGGSFGRDGEAVQGGFNAASELSPLWSNPQTCEPGETPLECEVRLQNPSIMLISLEVWWEGRSPDVYEKNMRQIIDFAISKGILPILSTKADNVEGDHSINLATAKLAYEYDLPLWNWWRAAQALPNRGLDPDRPDGFHISLDSWDARSFTALQTIDSVWRGVSQNPAAEEPTAQNNLLPPVNPLLSTGAVEPTEEVCAVAPGGAADCGNTADAGAIPIFTPVTDPALMANPEGLILFSTASRTGETITPLGVFAMNPQTGTVFRLLPQGTSLQAVSPDGRQILYSRGRDLIVAVLDGSQQGIINTQFVNRGGSSAGWQMDGKALLFLTEESGQTLLAKYPLDGSTTWMRLSTSDETPLDIYPAVNADQIYWQNGTCPPKGACDRTAVFASAPDGSSREFIAGAVKTVFSSDGKWLAYETQNGGRSVLTLAPIDLKDRRALEGTGNNLLDFSWSPDGSRLSVLALDRSDYSGEWLDIRNLIISISDMGTKILPPAVGVNTRAVWSPAGTSLLLTGTLESAGGSVIQARVMDTTSGAGRDLTVSAGLSSDSFIYTTQIFWVKPIQ